MAKALTYEKALSILKGTVGIKVDEKKKIQTWTTGKLYSKKVVEAGKLLDLIGEGKAFTTIWVRPDGEIPAWKGKK